MGYDTIRIVSPTLSENTARQLEHNCTLRQGIEISTGDLIYQITTGDLSGSYDNRIMVKVIREEFTYEKGVTRKINIPPKVILEASIHKQLEGHNINNAPTNFHECCWHLVTLVEELTQTQLPYYKEWEVKRIDVAYVFDLTSPDIVSEYIKSLKLCHYPRRKPQVYGNEAIFFPGSTTSTKIYHKGPEFKKHDYRRISEQISKQVAEHLLKIAYNLVRIEVGIKIDKFRYDLKCNPIIDQITDEYIDDVYEKEVTKLLKMAKAEKEIVRTAATVERRLKDLHGSRLANTLLGTWFRLSVGDEMDVKKGMSEQTFYRHKKFLIEAGCDWKATDVRLLKFAIVPSDFFPLKNDIRRIA